MSETPADVGDIAVNDHTWAYEYVEGNGRHYWYRAMTDGEVRNHSDGRFDGVDAIDIPMASPPDYPIYEIELYPLPGEKGYKVTASRTELGGATQSARRSPIGGEYTRVRDEMSAAVQTVEGFARELS